MKNFVPWFVTVAVCSIVGMVLYSYAFILPVTPFDVFNMIGMIWCAGVIIRGYFKMYAIFDRIDKR